LGGETMMLLKDGSSPIWGSGRHWGFSCRLFPWSMINVMKSIKPLPKMPQ
jgi:hypothetical protein